MFSSTFTTHQQQQQQQQQSHSLKRQRRVAFAAQLVVIPQVAVSEPSTWYSTSDYRAFKAAFANDAKELVRSTKSSAAAAAVKDYLKRALEQSHQSDDLIAVNADLKTQVRDNLHVVIGLERMTTRVLAQQKSRRRSQLVKAVLDLQDESDVQPNLSYEFEADLIRQACETITRPSQRLARSLAHLSAQSL